MNTCPHCGRKLLSHISLRCNWCGVEIEDPAYRAQAEVERAAFRAEDALHSLQSLTISQTTNLNTQWGYGGQSLGVPLMSPSDAAALVSRRVEYEAWEQARQAAVVRAQQKATETALTEEPADELEDRFGHLEL